MQLSNVCDLKSLKSLFLMLVCYLPAGLSFAQGATSSERAAIEIISIEHRDPMFIRALLTSSLDPRGNIGLVDNKLIIASTAGNLQQLKALIADADIPARRLVVSVDFDWGSIRSGNNSQQSSQALEGDAISFSDSAAGVSADAELRQPSVVINSTIRGEVVEADVEVLNVPGFSGRHPLSLMLGEWYVINPDAEPETAVGLQSGIEIFEEFPMPDTEPLSQAPMQAGSSVAPIAIRVDVLP
ncbi:MAG: hypothetical protein Q8K97_09795 [Pseudohongiella sp.]|nr:hypothetical protein [Pseudohongiella sp.]